MIKRSLCALVSLDIKMLSTSSVFTLSQRAYCVRERKERNTRGKERKSKSDRASGRNKWELSKDEAGVAHSLVLRFLLSYKSTKSLEKKRERNVLKGER